MNFEEIEAEKQTKNSVLFVTQKSIFPQVTVHWGKDKHWDKGKNLPATPTGLCLVTQFQE